MNPALVLIAASFAVALALGIRARRGHPMTLEQWSVGGRGFGTIFVFVLMAGEIYTTFTFLGGSGWAYGKGAPAFYILCYGTLAYGMSYFLLPVVWRYANAHALVSQADFFVRKYGSESLGIVVSLVSVAAMIPYLVLQLKGLGIIVSEASAGAISATQAVWAGSLVLVMYVVVSGVRGSAWTAVLKDIMILGVALVLGTYLPAHLHGGFSAMFAQIDRVHPGLLTLPRTGMSPAWFISTVLLTTLGFYMWPHTFGSCYTARNENVFRRNAVLMPLYQLVLLFVFFTGFAALLEVPGLTGDVGRLVVAAGDRPRVRAVDAGCGRCGGTPHGARAGIDAAHVGVHDSVEERVRQAGASRRPRGAGCVAGPRAGSRGGARVGGAHTPRRLDARAAAARRVQRGDAALPGVRLESA